MEPSFVGLAVFVLLYLVGRGLGSGPLGGLMASLPLGSTAFVELPALGGSTPPVYTLFALVLLGAAFLRRDAPSDLRAVFAGQRSAWIVLCLMFLAIVVTVASPRLFAGATPSLLPVDKLYVEAPLRPSSKNVTQGGYFVLGTLIYFAVSLLLHERPRHALVVKAFFAFSVVHTASGLLDLVAKRAGAGDVFAPLRTAGYRMLATDDIAGFPRLTGAQPEASTFAVALLACLAFSYSYWRHAGSRFALALAFANLLLAFLSTSSTAYLGLVILHAPIGWRIAGSILRGGRPAASDRRITLLALVAASISLVVFATYERGSSLHDLLNLTLLDKAATASGVERLQFNVVSLRNFVDTYGLGVGLGSSRASSWPVAVLGQLGLAGALLVTPLVVIVLRGMSGVPRRRDNEALLAAGKSVCAAAIGGTAAISISSGSADPGPVFFIALAAASSWRRHARRVPAEGPQREGVAA